MENYSRFFLGNKNTKRTQTIYNTVLTAGLHCPLHSCNGVCTRAQASTEHVSVLTKHKKHQAQHSFSAHHGVSRWRPRGAASDTADHQHLSSSKVFKQSRLLVQPNFWEFIKLIRNRRVRRADSQFFAQMQFRNWCMMTSTGVSGFISLYLPLSLQKSCSPRLSVCRDRPQL